MARIRTGKYGLATGIQKEQEGRIVHGAETCSAACSDADAIEQIWKAKSHETCHFLL
jgi:hypothetical protein